MIITTKQHKLLMSKEQIKTADALTRNKILRQEIDNLIDRNRWLQHRIENQVKMLNDKRRDDNGRYKAHYEGSF